VPKWYDIINPHFCDAVQDMTSVSSRGSDLNSSESEEDDIGCQSDVSSEGGALEPPFLILKYSILS